MPHHSDASLGPDAYRRPVTPYSDGPSRAEQPDYRRAASPHGPPPQPYDGMPPVDAYGRPRYPGWYVESPIVLHDSNPIVLPLGSDIAGSIEPDDSNPVLNFIF